MKIPPGVDPEVYKAFIEQRKTWPLGERLLDNWRKWKPFGLTITVTRPRVSHECVFHGHGYMAPIRGRGMICRECLESARG